MAIDLLAIDFATGEERGNILICRPVDGNAEVITILRLEVGLVLFIVEPVVTEPVEVRELLVGKLIELLVGSGGELAADEIIQIKARIGNVLALKIGRASCRERRRRSGVAGVVDRDDR